jgi:hypothetical protein
MLSGLPSRFSEGVFRQVEDPESPQSRWIIGCTRRNMLSLAAEPATGKLLMPDQFSGGQEANLFLKGLGFRIRRYAVPFSSHGISSPQLVPRTNQSMSPQHSAHSREGRRGWATASEPCT